MGLSAVRTGVLSKQSGSHNPLLPAPWPPIPTPTNSSAAARNAHRSCTAPFCLGFLSAWACAPATRALAVPDAPRGVETGQRAPAFCGCCRYRGLLGSCHPESRGEGCWWWCGGGNGGGDEGRVRVGEDMEACRRDGASKDVWPPRALLALSLSLSTLSASTREAPCADADVAAAAGDGALGSRRRKETLDSMLDLDRSFAAMGSSEAFSFPFPWLAGVIVPVSSSDCLPLDLPVVRSVCSNEVRSRLNVVGRPSTGAAG